MRVQIAKAQTTLAECQPNLMPFHIGYDGKAPMSTYFHVRPAPQSQYVGAPSTNSNNDASGTLSSSDTPEAPAAAAGPALAESKPKKNRFLSAFRGRTMHGLEVGLPEGYTGLILQPASPSSAAATGTWQSTTTTQQRRRPSVKEKMKSLVSRRRTRRGKVQQQQNACSDEDEEDDAEMMDAGAGGDGAGDEGEEEIEQEDHILSRTLVPVGQFQGFTLWNADIPVDEGEDVYVRSLTEWYQISDAVSSFTIANTCPCRMQSC